MTQSAQRRNLPYGWVWAEVGDICDAVNGKTFKPSDCSAQGTPIVRIQNLRDRNAKYNHFDGEFDHRFEVMTGDLLFAWSGTPGTSFGAHFWKGPRAVLNQHIFNIQFDQTLIAPAFLQEALNRNVADYVSQAQGGVGLAHITKTKFMASFVPIAPLPEQRRIVAEGSGATLDAMGTVTVSPVSGKGDRVAASWPAVNGATGYRVEWKTGRGSYTTVTRSDAAATTETITGLEPQTTYQVKVTALHTIDGSAADGDSAEGTGTTYGVATVDPNSDPAPDLMSFTTSNGIGFSWKSMSDVGGRKVTGYTIEWAPSADGAWVDLNYPGGYGRRCISGMEPEPDSSKEGFDVGCYFAYADGVADGAMSRGDTRHFRLVAYAGNVKSPPGNSVSWKLGDV